LQEAKRRRQERKMELRKAAGEAMATGGDVALAGMDSDYSMPDDHSPNTHGRKSRTVPPKDGTSA